jgi:hypothetical protein
VALDDIGAWAAKTKAKNERGKRCRNKSLSMPNHFANW